MATMVDSLDSMDEFFDFTQLEHDDALHAFNPSEQWPLPTQPIGQSDSAMDWQHSVPEDPFASTITLSCPSDFENDMYSPAADLTSSHSQQNQWGSPMDSWQPSHVAPINTIVIPLNHLNTAIPVFGAQSINGIHSHSSCAPPSSSLVLQENADPFDGQPQAKHDITTPQSPLPELPVKSQSGPQISAPIDAILEESHSQGTRPPMPSRQTSLLSRKPASAKHKGPQSRIPLEARQILEDEFAANPYPCSWELDIIAHQANLDVKKVRNWFNNTRSRKKCSDPQIAVQERVKLRRNSSSRSLNSKLSRDSLEALDKQTDEDLQPPQPPLAFYLAQSYQEEAVDLTTIQAAIDSGPLEGSGDFQTDASSSFSKMQSPGSVITSVHSSEGTAPTTYTVSSSGSNISSFGRDRRRGRRRMTWKQSPYTRPKFNGLNSAGEPQEDLPFFCTFCPRAFKTKYEWVRHEDSVHALRTTWICCDTKNVPLQSCPFCGQMYPDEVHMASHKYQQCRNKPESQRTFYRRDHFIQHLHHVHFSNVKHPSVRLGCQARLMASEGHNFGCKDLAMKWRRFGAPMKRDDPMLHCGFCGKRSKDWPERCEHVAEHLIARSHDRSAWWPERLENHLENLCCASDVGPFRCRYCRKVFDDHNAMNKHSHCRVWSCRFLQTFDDVATENAGPPLCPQFPSPKAHHCHLCGAGYRAFHVEHAQHYHRYRQCTQELFTSEEEFLQHIHEFHGASHPSLLQSSSVIEQNFSRNKGASFETVGLHKTDQISAMDVDIGLPAVEVANQPSHQSAIHYPQAQNKPQTSPPRKSQTRETTHMTPQPASTKPQRKRTNTDTSSPESASKDPRFFRLRSHSLAHSFLPSRIFYTRHGHAKQPAVACEEGTVLEEMPMGNVAALAMSAGLVGMAGVRWAIGVKLGDGRAMGKGVVELGVEEVDEEE